MPRSDGAGWLVVYYLQGQRRRETFATRTAARERAAAINYNLTTYGHPDPHNEWTGGTEKTIKEILQKYIDKSERRVAAKTLQGYKSHVSKILQEWGHMRLDQINGDFLMEWSRGFQKQGYSPRYERHLVRLLAQAVRSLGIDYDPTRGYQGRRIEGAEPEYYTVDEVRTILRTVFPRFRTVVAVQLFTGIRPSEAANLGEEKIHVDERYIVVDGKRGRRIVEGMPDTVWWWLEMGWYDPTNYTRNIHALRKDLEKVGVKWIHDGLRHTFATYHVALTDYAATAKIGGWTNPYTLRNHYVGATRKILAEEFFAIRPENPPNHLIGRR